MQHIGCCGGDSLALEFTRQAAIHARQVYCRPRLGPSLSTKRVPGVQSKHLLNDVLLSLNCIRRFLEHSSPVACWYLAPRKLRLARLFDGKIDIRLSAFWNCAEDTEITGMDHLNLRLCLGLTQFASDKHQTR